jgi:hypothetical protein
MIKGDGTSENPWYSVFVNLIDITLVNHINEPGEFVNIQIMNTNDGEIHILTFNLIEAKEMARRILDLEDDG